MFSIADFKSIASEIGGVINEGVGIYEKVKNAGKNTVPVATVPTPPPAYDPNIGVKDFAFKPYYPLLIIGGVLLVIALVLRK